MYKTILVPIEMSHIDVGKSMIDVARKHSDENTRIILLHVIEELPSWAAAGLPKDALNSVLLKSDSKALFVGKMEKWGDRAEGVPDHVQTIRFPHYEGNAKITIGQAFPL